MFCCQSLFTITARCGNISGPCVSSSAKSVESCCRKGSVGPCDSVEILLTKYILFGEFLTPSSLATSVSRWLWSGMLILSSGISSSLEVSTYLLPGSTLALTTQWPSCITHLALALVLVLVRGLILLAGGSSLDKPRVLFLCLNTSASVLVKLVRPDLNVSAILSSFSCCLFSESSKCLRIYLEESVPTVSSAAMSFIFSLFKMIKIKIKVKIKTKYFHLVFFCCCHVELSFTSRADRTSHACALSHIGYSP